MASSVYEPVQITLQDGTEVEVRPLTISKLRRFIKEFRKLTELMKNIDETEGATEKQEDEAMEINLNLVAIALEKADPDLAKDRERLEDSLDTPTMNKILEVAGGVDTGPNPRRAAQVGKT